MKVRWQNICTIEPRGYVCSYCSSKVASEKGYAGLEENGGERYVYVCPQCNHPTYFYRDSQVPRPASGDNVQHTPKDVGTLYNEARRCLLVNAFTSSVLASRRLLMRVAVSRGAREGLEFCEYVDYLAANNYVPPDGEEWVDHIRAKGREASHEIALMTRDDAVDLIQFSEMLLKTVYEFRGKLRIKTKAIETANPAG